VVSNTVDARAGRVDVRLEVGAGLNKTGNGDVVLNAANTFSGDIVVQEGALVLGNDAALGSSRLVLNGGSLKGDVGAQVRQVENNISIQADTGLGGAGGHLELKGAVDLGGQSRALGVEGDVLLSGNIQNGGLVKQGDGTLKISSESNAYEGGTQVKGGVLSIVASGAGALGQGGVVVDGGAFDTGGTTWASLTLNGLEINAGEIRGNRVLTVAGEIVARGHGDSTVNVALRNASQGLTSLTKTGAGALVLNKANGFNGGITIAEGQVVAGTSGALGSGRIVLNGGGLKSVGAQTVSNALDVAGSISLDGGAEGMILSGSVNLTGADRTLSVAGRVTISSVISNGAFTKDGLGDLVLSSSNPELTSVTMKSGSLWAERADSLGLGNLVLSGGIVYAGTHLSLASISFQGGELKGQDLALSKSLEVTAGKFDQVIAGTSGVVKTGSGIFEISGLNTFSGDTNVAAGTVLISGPSPLGRGAVKLQGGVLAPRGDVTLQPANTLEVLGDATLGGDLGKLTVTGRTALAQDVGLTVVGDVVLGGSVSGTLNKKGAGNLVLAAANGDLGNVAVSQGTVSVGTGGALGFKGLSVGAEASLDLSAVPKYVFTSDPSAQSGSEVREITVNGTVKGASMEFTAGTVLKGAGRLDGEVVLNNAVLAPGNSPGTITVGTIRIAGTSSFYQWQRVDIGAGGAPASGVAYDRVIVQNGAGSDLSALHFIPTNTATGLPIPVASLAAGGDSFAYDQVKGVSRYTGVIQGNLSPASLPTFEVHTAVIKVSLVPSETSTPGVDLYIDRTPYASFAQNPNASAFGAYLNRALQDHYDKPNDSLGELLRRLDCAISGSEVSAALSALNPGGAYSNLHALSRQRAASVSTRLEDRLSQVATQGADDAVFSLGVSMRGDPKNMPAFLTPYGEIENAQWNAWTTGYVSNSVLEADNALGFGRSSARSHGDAVGVERMVGNLRAGVMLAFGEDNASFEDASVSVSGENWTFGGYGSVQIGALTVDASALWSRGEEKSMRPMARADFATQTRQLGLGVAVNLLPASSGWQLTPLLRLKILESSQDGFEERGTGLLFRADGLSETTVLSKLGLRLAHISNLSTNVNLGLDGAAYWVHDFDSAGKTLGMGVLGSSGNFHSTGRASDADTAQINLGIQSTFSNKITIRLSGQREMGASSAQNSGLLSVLLQF
jgi:autotransporter-associated beta strand protein